MRAKIPVKMEFSSGGVIYKKQQGNIFVVLISVGNGKVLSLPKGLINKEEKPENAALREVKEETGCYGEIEDFLGKIEYWYRKERNLVHKFVYYFLIRYTGGDTRNHDWEVESADWFQIDEAIEKISYDNERDILRIAKRKLEGRNS